VRSFAGRILLSASALAFVPVAVAADSPSETPISPAAVTVSSTLTACLSWVRDHRECSIIFGILLLALVIVTAILLISAGKKSTQPPHISTLNASFFFWLGLAYTVLLLLVAVFYDLTWTDSRPMMFGGILPAAVPWFGALGAVVISLEGIFAYGQKQWDQKYNYWHVGRPLFGAVLGIVAFFTFVLIVSSAGTVPPFLDSKPAAPKDFIVYYVVAFLVGYREETFRELIRRVTDMILKPVESGGTAPVVTFKNGGAAISTLDFLKSAVNTAAAMTIEIANTGNGTLLSPSAALDSASAGPFKLTLDQLTNIKELKPGESKSVEITFQSAVAGRYSGTLIVTGSNLSTSAKLQLSATV
jgi:hypothetical protein